MSGVGDPNWYRVQFDNPDYMTYWCWDCECRHPMEIGCPWNKDLVDLLYLV